MRKQRDTKPFIFFIYKYMTLKEGFINITAAVQHYHYNVPNTGAGEFGFDLERANLVKVKRVTSCHSAALRSVFFITHFLRDQSSRYRSMSLPCKSKGLMSI